MRTRLALLPLSLFAAAAGAQTKPLTLRFSGTWTLNIAKSTLPPPAPKSETAVIEGSIFDTTATRYTITGTNGDGKPINVAWQGKIDGKPYPIVSNGRAIGTTAYRYSARNQLSEEEQLDNGTTYLGTMTLSADEKSIVIQGHTVTKQGAYDTTADWDKS